jgi:hypothetical protein
VVRISTLLAIIALSAGGCGGTPSSGPGPSSTPVTPPATQRAEGTVLTVSSLASLQPIGGAILASSTGQQFPGDQAGRITLTSPLDMSSVVTISAPNFLERRTVLSNHVTFTLWPRTDPATNLTEEFTRDVVYDADCGRKPPRRMIRLAPGVTHVYIVPTPDIMQQRQRPQPWALAARDAHERAVAELNHVLGPSGTRFELVDTHPASGFVVPVTVGPTAHTCSAADAFASYSLNGRGEIIGGAITHCGLTTPENDGLGTANLPSVMLHEMGHLIGLSHSRDLGDAMFTAACPSWTGTFGDVEADTFSARERLVLLMMLQRNAGNAFPDNDAPGAPASGAPGGRTVIVH